jgi:hypothetical protein
MWKVISTLVTTIAFVHLGQNIQREDWGWAAFFILLGAFANAWQVAEYRRNPWK